MSVEHANKKHEESLSPIDKIALKITGFVGTMSCAALFTLIALVSLPSAIRTGDIITIISWIAQTFLQLVLLSIIMVGQNLQSRHSQKHASMNYDIGKKVDELLTHVKGESSLDFQKRS